ncbi:MAG TPA: HNH endonuclease [Dongiaceae bacterium]|nr:HNH endonuclease [Dongiaceae bacterium]
MRKIRTRKRVKAPGSNPAGPCPLCERPMVAGSSLDQHHPMPRSHGGRETVTMHKICHRAIHAMLSERELAEDFTDFDKLRAHTTLAQFIAWVKKRPPEYYDRTRWSKSRRFKG